MITITTTYLLQIYKDLSFSHYYFIVIALTGLFLFHNEGSCLNTLNLHFQNVNIISNLNYFSIHHWCLL